MLILMLTLAGTLTTRATDPDLSSPRAAARSLYQAVEAEDGDAILKTFYAKDDGERELARAFADLIVSGKKLADAAKNKFNATGEAFGGGMISKEDLAKLDAAEVSENGDTATLTRPGLARPMHFHRAAGQWQLMIGDFANTEDIGVAHQTYLLKRVAGVMGDMAADINSGKYATATDAEEAIKTKLASAMVAAARMAATRSATKPTTTPATQPK